MCTHSQSGAAPITASAAHRLIYLYHCSTHANTYKHTHNLFLPHSCILSSSLLICCINSKWAAVSELTACLSDRPILWHRLDEKHSDLGSECWCWLTVKGRFCNQHRRSSCSALTWLLIQENTSRQWAIFGSTLYMHVCVRVCVSLRC